MSYPLARYLNIRGASGGHLSPDGRQLAFISTLTGLPQGWVVDAGSGWPHRVTFTDHAVRSIAWSPDGTQLLYTMDTDGNERHQLYVVLPDGSGERALTAQPEVMHLVGDWSPDSQRIAYSCNARDPRYFDVWELEVASGASRLVLAADATLYAGDYSPDGSRLLVHQLHGSLDGDLLSLELASGDTTLLTPHEGVARFDHAAWRPDGEAVYCVTDLDAEFCYLAELPLDGGELRQVVAPEWDVDGLAVARDGLLAYTVNAGGRSQLRLRDETHDGPVDDLPLGVVSGIRFSASGRRLSCSVDGPEHPLDIWVLDRTRGEARQVTFSGRAGLPADAFVVPSLVQYPSFDGLPIPGWFYQPASDGPYPAILYIHGGPESQTRASFNPLIPFFVHQGFAVLAMNVRGSTGYGKTFHRLDDKRLRLNSVDDAAAAVEWLASHGCDRERMVCFGGSYGGFMVLSLITRHPDLWAAAVDIVGISNFVTFLEQTGAYRRKLRESEYGSLEEDGDFLREISPINHVAQVRCPLFVVQGAQDPRVPQGVAREGLDHFIFRDAPAPGSLADDQFTVVVERHRTRPDVTVFLLQVVADAAAFLGQVIVQRFEVGDQLAVAEFAEEIVDHTDVEVHQVGDLLERQRALLFDGLQTEAFQHSRADAGLLKGLGHRRAEQLVADDDLFALLDAGLARGRLGRLGHLRRGVRIAGPAGLFLTTLALRHLFRTEEPHPPTSASVCPRAKPPTPPRAVPPRQPRSESTQSNTSASRSATSAGCEYLNAGSGAGQGASAAPSAASQASAAARSVVTQTHSPRLTATSSQNSPSARSSGRHTIAARPTCGAYSAIAFAAS